MDPEIDPTSGKTFFRSAEETTANLSESGAYLNSWEPLAAGRRVIVSIDLPSSQELQLTARVVWTRRELRPTPSKGVEEPGYGVEFDEVSSRELSRLARWIDGLDTKTKRPESGAPGTTATAQA